MIDRYTKVLLTVIAVNLTVMTGWGAVEVLVPEIRASTSDWQEVVIVGHKNTDGKVRHDVEVNCRIGCR